jgi:hypothetical protein
LQDEACAFFFMAGRASSGNAAPLPKRSNPDFPRAAHFINASQLIITIAAVQKPPLKIKL